MGRCFRLFSLAGTVLMLMVLACNLSTATPTLNANATMIAATVTAVQTSAPSLQTTAPPSVTSTPAPTDTFPPQVTSTPANPVVIRDSLCWLGPGDVYEVVSSVKTGTQVKLLGRGSLSGWLIISNPIYHDPCWIKAANLQIDTNYDLSALPVVNPPPTPTPTITNTPKPTNTP